MKVNEYDRIKRSIRQLRAMSGISAHIAASTVADRIAWAWKWRKINEAQKNELCNTMIEWFAYN